MKWYESWLKKLKRASGRHGYTCDSCGEEVYDYPVHRVCLSCETHLERNAAAVCDKCGRKGITEGVCLTCKQHMPLFDWGISPFVYRSTTAGLVNKIKNGNRRLALYFGEQMATSLVRALPSLTARFGGEYMIVPVPLTKEKRRERGYNQAEELAEAVVDSLQTQGVTLPLYLDVLEKKREAEQQKHLRIDARIENAKHAYHLHRRKLCEGKTVILVDDILTTGATGSACATLLRSAGAACVVLLTAASLPEKPTYV